MKRKVMQIATVAVVVAGTLSYAAVGPASAEFPDEFDQSLTYGSVEAIPNPAVVDTTPLRSQSLAVREAFVQRVLACGYVDRVIDALTETGAVNTIDDDSTDFAVGAGGFNGRTTASIVYTAVDTGPDAASTSDIEILTNSLGYVFSQGSAFLLDADQPSSFDFPANYLVVQFDETPTIEESAALFDTVGIIDPDLFATSTSGYTQYGSSYLSLQSAVDDQQFIDGYVAAVAAFNDEFDFEVEYTPIVGGEPSLYEGGAAFPGNNWRTNTEGQSYLGRIPADSHDELGEIRDAHLDLIGHAQRAISRGGNAAARSEMGLIQSVSHLPCRL